MGEKEKVGPRPTNSKGESLGWQAGTTGKVQRKLEGVRPVVFQLLCAVPLALGTRGLRIRPTACSNQAVCVTSHPCHLVSALRRPLFLSWSQEAGDTCGDRCTIWQGEQIPGKRREGLNAQCPRGPSSVGVGGAPSWFPCRITKESRWSLEHQVFVPKPPGANLHSVLPSTTVS